MLPRSDATAFDQLKYLIDSEPHSIVGEDWLGMLAAIDFEGTVGGLDYGILRRPVIPNSSSLLPGL